MPSRLSPGPGSGRRWVRLSVRLCVRLSQLLLRTCYVAVALFGVLVTPPTVMLLVVPAITLGTVVFVAGLVWYCEQRWPARRTLRGIAGTTAALLPFLQGGRELAGVGTMIAFVVLGLVIIVGASWVNSLAAGANPVSTVQEAGGDGSLSELLQVLPLETVFNEWRDLQEHPDSRCGPSNADAGVRALLLDEMQRRDPAGFAEWLSDGATDSPERHIRGDQGLAA